MMLDIVKTSILSLTMTLIFMEITIRYFLELMCSPNSPFNKNMLERTAANYLIIYLVNQLFISNNDADLPASSVEPTDIPEAEEPTGSWKAVDMDIEYSSPSKLTDERDEEILPEVTDGEDFLKVLTSGVVNEDEYNLAGSKENFLLPIVASSMAFCLK